jgi:hypothetical protein
MEIKPGQLPVVGLNGANCHFKRLNVELTKKAVIGLKPSI